MNSTYNPHAVSPPDGVIFEKSAQGVSIAYRWFRLTNLLLLLVCLAWDALIIYNLVSVVFSAGQRAVTVCTLTAGLLGLGLTYVALVGTLNRTVIHLNARELSIRQQPIPYLRSHVIPLAILKQLKYEKILRKQVRGKVVIHDLSAILKDGQRLFIIDSETPDLPRFIQQEIEGWLAQYPSQYEPPQEEEEESADGRR